MTAAVFVGTSLDGFLRDRTAIVSVLPRRRGEWGIGTKKYRDSTPMKKAGRSNTV